MNKGKRLAAQKHRAHRRKTEVRTGLARRLLKGDVNLEQVKKLAGPAYPGVLRIAVDLLQREQPASASTAAAVQRALASIVPTAWKGGQAAMALAAAQPLRPPPVRPKMAPPPAPVRGRGRRVRRFGPPPPAGAPPAAGAPVAPAPVGAAVREAPPLVVQAAAAPAPAVAAAREAPPPVAQAAAPVPARGAQTEAEPQPQPPKAEAPTERAEAPRRRRVAPKAEPQQGEAAPPAEATKQSDVASEQQSPAPKQSE
ncbi:MAG: hypothetical protein HY683_02595 [Chloroflexi bacterium]|nr:hypothetical protein [Chloroflexota bacterium]